MTPPEFLFHFEAPTAEPLLQPFHVSGWCAAGERITRIGGADGAGLTLGERPDVRAAHPGYAHVVGFSGNVNFRSLANGRIELAALIGSREVRFAAALRPVVLPPDHLQVRQVGAVWGKAFFVEGRRMFDEIRTALSEAGQPLESAGRVLDFGCGCGRVIWMFQHLPHTGEVWGCDIDGEAMAWNAAHLGAIAQFKTNPPMPPAPFPDGYFDAIYSVSVFTHLPEEMQFAWLAELRRLLRPGGVLLASLHGRRYWSADPGVKAEVESRGFAYRTGQRTEGLPDFYMVAYHAESYVRREWARFFEVLEVRERFLHDAHDIALGRRRADPPPA